MFKSGYVTIIGRPNVGKSTLINYIMGEKLSIVSNRPQTTRNNIQTILTTKESQIIFVDTPGMHKPRHKLGEYMVKVAKQSASEVDVILFITTPGDEIDKGDMHILEQFKDTKIPVFLLVNKIDENTQERVAKTIQGYSEYFNFKEIIPIAAIKGKNIDIVTKLVEEHIPEGPLYYPEDMITDQQERFIITEIIREKALKLLSQEVPHGIAVEIISMKRDKKEIYNIEVNLLCEKDSHKGIIIGKGGKTLKQISTYARQDIMKLLGENIHLRLWVKVKKEWRDTSSILKELGYK
ncbi:GTPase Era [Clostridium sp. CM028]|uniref:GTPase Era n=1 Tax=Clostridium TaxID=1485 RepID=UPI0013EEB6B7|nr:MULTISPECIES: GTPase Era [Clostridium]MBU3090728.1 GTPase Era [Clostridium sp. CF011]MBW9144278.1 GTPase Era [Clostridium sp. CM027]MBW9147412.1 GTPase Era [Clostridium sp. CM028]MBZ9608486.1 GTPase Era [Clostridium estertheticum]UVE41087.1 GTPase Era [Clostridium sp. CM027]